MSKTLFLSHGGGPLPLLGDPPHAEMVVYLQKLAKQLPKPDAIIVISAHWEADKVRITANNTPDLLYDYYGFPEEAYQIVYPCPGKATLANDIQEMLNRADIESELDEKRGLDHGVFVPLKIMYPSADIPCMQLSLLNTLDPLQHIKVGQSLQRLQDQNVLLMGSGFSFHNMKAFFAKNTEETIAQNQAFEHWLIDTCTNANYTEQDRAQRLIDWAKAPGARFCHPREEHLLPLHVCYGYAERPCPLPYSLEILKKQASFYLWD